MPSTMGKYFIKEISVKKKKHKHEPLTWLGIMSIFTVPLVFCCGGEQAVAPVYKWGSVLGVSDAGPGSGHPGGEASVGQ